MNFIILGTSFVRYMCSTVAEMKVSNRRRSKEHAIVFWPDGDNYMTRSLIWTRQDVYSVFVASDPDAPVGSLFLDQDRPDRVVWSFKVFAYYPFVG